MAQHWQKKYSQVKVSEIFYCVLGGIIISANVYKWIFVWVVWLGTLDTPTLA